MPGQINRNSELGEIVYSLATNKQYKNYVEIGTWNGQGSTVCFWDGLSARDDDWLFFSFESDISFYEQAKVFFGEKANAQFNLVYGRIINTEDMMPLDSPIVTAHYENHDHQGIYNRFFKYDVKAYQECDNKLKLLDGLNIDVLLLDGGEFSTFAEFEVLKSRTKIIILDDTKELKTKGVHEYLLNNPDWICKIESDDRNGFSIHEHKDKKHQ
tara:strand:- start:146 stop:784 length:639 start_codon:yes stop_codon:yes gene_type:complete